MENQSTNALARLAMTAIRRPLVVVVSVALIMGIGLYLKWPAIVALGFAPLILTLAPCALMCALGLCAVAGSRHKPDGKPPTREDL